MKHVKNYIEQESGRSMVEMLGVLAIIGVLSVGGISGYTTAMNKHKANEILNAAAVRAMAVSTQLQSGTPIGSVSLGEFDNENSVGGATFAAGVTDAGNNRFTIGFANNGKPSDAVIEQMQNIAGTDGIVRDLTGTGITYNNDLTADKIASDYKDSASCGTFATTGRTWCGSKCAEGNDCCSVMTYDSQCQTCSAGSVSNITNGTTCNYGEGTDNGQCTNGECKEKPQGPTTLFARGILKGYHYDFFKEYGVTLKDGICPSGYKWAGKNDLLNEPSNTRALLLSETDISLCQTKDGAACGSDRTTVMWLKDIGSSCYGYYCDGYYLEDGELDSRPPEYANTFPLCVKDS